jgi:hypothetical protein
VINTGTACCDFYICFRQDQGLGLTIQYDAGRFSGGLVRQMTSDYQHILETIISRPETLIRNLNIVPVRRLQ